MYQRPSSHVPVLLISGYFASQVGHSDERVAAAVAEQMRKTSLSTRFLNNVTPRYTNIPHTFYFATANRYRPEEQRALMTALKEARTD